MAPHYHELLLEREKVKKLRDTLQMLCDTHRQYINFDGYTFTTADFVRAEQVLRETGPKEYNAARPLNDCFLCGETDFDKLFVVVNIGKDGKEELDYICCVACAEKNKYCLCCGHHEQDDNKIAENSGGFCKACLEDSRAEKYYDYEGPQKEADSHGSV